MPGQDLQNYFREGRNLVSDYLYKGGNSKYWEDSWNNAAFQYALSEYEFDRNKEMWDLMNEYNSPANQMARFKEAGLNPMLAYTQGTPGNASSMPQYSKPDAKLTPQQDQMNRVRMASELIGTVSNMVQNVMGMYDSSLDLKMKENEVAYSNYDRRLLEHWAPKGSLALSPGSLWSEHQQEKLNPFSPNFDPFAFEFLSKRGSLPQFYSEWFYNLPKKDYTEARTQYQNFYNKHILPLFEDYQQNKIDLQEYEERLLEYQEQAREMIPPELRGILEPVMDWLSPFFKFIFKKGSFTHTVKQ